MKILGTRIAAYLCAIAVFLYAGCGSMATSDNAQSNNATNAETQVNAALSRYRELILGMEPASIALLFIEHGSVSHGEQAPIVGRQAIQAFLASFSNYKITEYELKPKSTHVEYGVATQVGTYRQVVTIPAGQTVTVQGTFVAKWELQLGSHWLLRSLHTESTAAVQNVD